MVENAYEVVRVKIQRTQSIPDQMSLIAAFKVFKILHKIKFFFNILTLSENYYLNVHIHGIDKCKSSPPPSQKSSMKPWSCHNRDTRTTEIREQH